MNPKLLVFLLVDSLLVAGVLFYVFAKTDTVSPSPDPVVSSVPSDSVPASICSADARGKFLDAFRSAHASGDPSAAMALVWTEDADPAALNGLKRSLADDFQAELVDAKITPLEDDATLEYSLRGVRYVPNLPPAGELTLTWKQGDTESTTTLLVGYKDRQYWIVSARPADESTDSDTKN